MQMKPLLSAFPTTSPTGSVHFLLSSHPPRPDSPSGWRAEGTAMAPTVTEQPPSLLASNWLLLHSDRAARPSNQSSPLEEGAPARNPPGSGVLQPLPSLMVIKTHLTWPEQGRSSGWRQHLIIVDFVTKTMSLFLMYQILFIANFSSILIK